MTKQTLFNLLKEEVSQGNITWNEVAELLHEEADFIVFTRDELDEHNRRQERMTTDFPRQD